MAVSTEASGQGRRASRAGRAVRELAPAYFALVMATGIVSVGTLQLGPDWLSRVLLVIARAGLVLAGAAVIARLAFFRDDQPAAGTPAAATPPSASPTPPSPDLPKAPHLP